MKPSPKCKIGQFVYYISPSKYNPMVKEELHTMTITHMCHWNVENHGIKYSYRQTMPFGDITITLTHWIREENILWYPTQTLL